MDSERLEQTRERAEQLTQELTEEQYLQMSGLTSTSDTSAIHARFPELSDRELVADLRAAHAAAAGTPQERGLRYLLDYLVRNLLRAETRDYTDRRLNLEARNRVEVGGDRIPFRKTGADLSREPDRNRRERIWKGRLKVVEEINPLIRGALHKQYEVARALGFSGYVDLHETLSQVDYSALAGIMDEFLVRTEDMYREVFRFAARKYLKLDPGQVNQHDLVWMFRGTPFDDRFPPSDLETRCTQFLRDMALSPTCHGRITLDLDARDGKTSRAFSAAIQVPRRIVLVINPTGGHEDYLAFLHELGHAQHLAHVDENLPFEFRHLGDHGVTESFAFLFEHLPLEAGWLKRYMDIDNPKDYLFLAWFRRLYLFRRYAAKLRYELALHREQAPDTAAQEYQETLSAALGVIVPGELYLYDLDPGFTTARYIRAWLFHGQLYKHLVHYFDEDWFRNPSAGQYLVSLWSPGHSITLAELAKKVGVERTDFHPIIEDFERYF